MSRSEEILCRSLRTILADLPNGANIPSSEPFHRQVLSGLEWWLPGIIAEVHPEWRELTLDGILPIIARKTGDGEAEIFGQCIFIDDQTLTPIYLRLQLAAIGDEISWLKCKVGEKGEHGMVRLPYESRDENSKRLHLVCDDPYRLDWVYSVTYGKKHPFLTLLVVRTRRIEPLLAFYRILGLEFTEEQHGSGPVHYAAKAGDLVFEIYPASDDRHVDSTTRLGFAVTNVDTTIAALQHFGSEVIAQPKPTNWGYRAIVRDPDGRAVEFCQQ